ncbi:MAG: hypothetical protein US97_C0015G0005 [Microgenomates group bacterium GW2011_GWF1_38_5]|nr:MAG: hypothetical protein US97_C0015G0005 [Microgenomates group bacterium GW2011_GWF1_38_5]
MPRKDTLSERLIKWLFWIFLVVYLFAGFYQFRYWIGKSFGWDYNNETDTLEVQGFGQVFEVISFGIVFLLLYGVYYLWKEAGTKNNWESIFNNSKDYIKDSQKAGVDIAKGTVSYLGTKSFWKNLLMIIFGIGIFVIPAVLFQAILSGFPILNTIILIGYAVLLLIIFLIGRKD